MLDSARARILADLPADALLLDVGAGASPFARADWVLDLMAYSDRGLYGPSSADERFTADTWVQRDMCAKTPWPFANGQFDFAVCSHTLEDIRDPVWVCEELQRVARAGYVEVPSLEEELTFGVQGDWVGWAHHHWLVDIRSDGSIDVIVKPHFVHKPGLHRTAPPTQRVAQLWWNGPFAVRERVMIGHDEIGPYVDAIVGDDGAPRSSARRGLRRRR